MLSRLSVAQRIYAAFGTVIILLVAIVVGAYFGVSGISQIFEDYRGTARQSLAVSGFVRNVADARTAELVYRLNPGAEEAAQVDAAISAFEAFHADAASLFAGTDVAATLNEAAALASDYRAVFYEMSGLQTEIDASVIALRDMGTTMRESSARALQAVSSNFNATGAAGFAAQNTVLTQFDTERFLLTNDTAWLDSAIADAETAKAKWMELHNAVISNSQKRTALELIETIDAYVAQAQATAGLIADRNALETGRLDVLGPQMQDAFGAMLDTIASHQDALGPAGAQRADFTETVVIGAGLAAILIGIGLAVMIARGLSGVIKSIAARMRQLANGDYDLDLNENQRHEIGQMIGALAVFRDNGRAIVAADAEKAEVARREAEANAIRDDLQARIQRVVSAAVAGDFSSRIDQTYDEAGLQNVADSVNTLMQTVEAGLSETSTVLADMAEQNLSSRVAGDYQGAFGELKNSTNAMAEAFSDVVGRLRDTSRALKTATSEILTGANDLSERTTRQAATIEETSAAMEQLAGMVERNTEAAGDALGKTRAAAALAEKGGHAMEDATIAMGRITTSSAKVSDIIKMIDDIAFQTNLLALNASVEAARAGEAGKGFAVVAVEVRRLAQSAAEASGEVKALIEQSSSEVEGGSKLVAQAAETLLSIRNAVAENAELMRTISDASREQSTAISEVGAAVRQLDEMTQHNAALVEETNAAIEQTEAQASELDTIVATFHLSDGGADLKLWQADVDTARATGMERKAG